MTRRSRLYHGAVVHNRLRPRSHRLQYRVFWLLLDLEEIDGVDGAIPLFSHNRFNLFSFYDADHGDAGAGPLRGQIERKLRAAAIDTVTRIEILCMPRIFGYQFNPLSVYFCRRSDDSCAAIIYEVHNTFGERHSYLFETGGDPPYEHNCAKDFFVSPFLGMDMTYAFRTVPPGDAVGVRIEGGDNEGALIVASLAGQRAPLTTGALLQTLLTCPLVTFKVILGIHWNALLMLAKGFRLQARPTAHDPSAKIARGTRP